MGKLDYTYYVENVYEIPMEFFHEHNYKYLFVDLDNTLTEDELHERPVKFDKWFAELSNNNIKLFIVSNNIKEQRVTAFVGDLLIEWYHRAAKQNGKLFAQIIADNKLPKEEVVVIGDRLTTDVVGGNKVGVDTILTKPFIKDKNIFTRYIIRPLEQLYIDKREKNK